MKTLKAICVSRIALQTKYFKRLTLLELDFGIKYIPVFLKLLLKPLVTENYLEHCAFSVTLLNYTTTHLDEIIGSSVFLSGSLSVAIHWDTTLFLQEQITKCLLGL